MVGYFYSYGLSLVGHSIATRVLHLHVYLQENVENENPIWKEFEVTLKDGNGNV
jgi:hypothetical protein